MGKIIRAFRIDEGPARVYRGDRGTLSKPRRMPNGFLQADAYFTRVGVFDYLTADGSTRRELRLPEEVFDSASMASFAMATLTNDHPPVPVTADNAKQYAVGHTGQDVRRDREKMRGTVVVTDSAAIRMMKKGKRQISNGYFCDLDQTSGVTDGIDGVEDGLSFDCIQRNIEGNHVALVARGRAGEGVEVRVDAMRCDGVDDVAFMIWRDDQEDSQEWRDLDQPFVAQDADDDKFAVIEVATGKRVGLLYADQQDAQNAAAVAVLTASAHTDNGIATARKRLDKHRATGDEMPFHLVGMFAFPIIAEMGLTITEVAQAMSLGEQEAENVLAGEVMPTGLQIEGLAELLDVPADFLRGLLPERQREQTDREDLKMEEFEITINGVTFKLKGDSAARQAVIKDLADKAARVDVLSAQVVKAEAEAKAKDDEAQAKLDGAKEKTDALQAKLDAATDPDLMRKQLDGRLDLERECGTVLGEDLDIKMTDDELRRAVITRLSPKADLAGKSDAYVAARFDAAVEGFDAEVAKNDSARTKTGEVRRAAHAARHVDNGLGEHSDVVAKAREEAAQKRRDMALRPLSFSKDGDNAIAN